MYLVKSVSKAGMLQRQMWWVGMVAAGAVYAETAATNAALC